MSLKSKMFGLNHLINCFGLSPGCVGNLGTPLVCKAAAGNGCRSKLKQDKRGSKDSVIRNVLRSFLNWGRAGVEWWSVPEGGSVGRERPVPKGLQSAAVVCPCQRTAGSVTEALSQFSPFP